MSPRTQLVDEFKQLLARDFTEDEFKTQVLSKIRDDLDEPFRGKPLSEIVPGSSFLARIDNFVDSLDRQSGREGVVFEHFLGAACQARGGHPDWQSLRERFAALPPHPDSDVEHRFQKVSDVSTNPLEDFWHYVGSYNSLLGWTVKAGFVAPLVPLIVGFGPPWDGGNVVQEKGGVALITAVAQTLALTSGFYFLSDATIIEMRRAMWRSLCACVLLFAAYVIAFVLLTEQQPNTSNRLISGWTYSELFLATLNENLGNIRTTKEDLQYEPLRIYIPWTVWSSLLIVTMTWIAFFSSFVFYLGAFVRSQEMRHSQNNGSSASAHMFIDNRSIRS